MSFEFRLPDIGEGVVEGEIVKWMVREGEILKEDQPMVEVMTDKATVEIPSPKGGKVEKIHVGEGKLCKVGQVMISIDDGSAARQSDVVKAPPPPSPAGGPVTHHAAPAKPSNGSVAAATPVAPVPFQAAPPSAQRDVLATPATRKLARDLGVDLAQVRGTGPAGRVTAEDIKAHGSGDGAGVVTAFSPAPAVALRGVDGELTERIPLRGLRRQIAQNMALSKQRAAHFTYVEECDMTEMVALRKRGSKAAEARGIKLSYLPFIVKAVVQGLKKFPMMNATLDDEKSEIVHKRFYHIGVATATDQGLIVPVVRNADRLSVFEIASEIDRVSQAAKTGKAKREEVTGSTFTISSLGLLGGVLATPIINYPEVAIIGVHKIRKTPVYDDAGQLVPRDLMNLSVSIDHRVVDGYEGAMFLQEVIRLLSDPAIMMLEMG